MSVNTIPTELPTRLQELLELKALHTDALDRIDATLDKIRAAMVALGTGGDLPAPTAAVAPSQISTSSAPTAPAPAAKKPAAAGRRGRRSGFSTTAEESVLTFIRQKRNPTTMDIKGLWDSEGRGGKADNLLSRLVKEKKLKRLAFEGGRGSRYTLS